MHTFPDPGIRHYVIAEKNSCFPLKWHFMVEEDFSSQGGSNFTKMDRIVLLLFACFVFIFCLGLPETGSHPVAQAKLVITVTSGQFSCLSLTSTGVTGLNHHPHFLFPCRNPFLPTVRFV